MRFTKMHGLGNDYLYVYGQVPQNVKDISVLMSDRHFGAGSDGMIFIGQSDAADFSMRIFNADGSEAMMCGNGIRCVGKYVYDKGYTNKKSITVDTRSGVKHLDLTVENGKVRYATVDMGKVCVSDKTRLEVCSKIVEGYPVNVGNPHFVIFTDDAEKAPLSSLGAAIEKHPYFKDGVNVEFVQVKDPRNLRMRVWERGSGITMACGTGTCASVAAAVKCGYCKEGEEVGVELDGGTLFIRICEDKAIMKGPAETVYEGETELC